MAATWGAHHRATPDLELEGLAREFVRRVEDLSKAAGLHVPDRIVLVYHAEAETAAAIQAYCEYVQAETLATELSHAGTIPDGAIDILVRRGALGLGSLEEARLMRFRRGLGSAVPPHSRCPQGLLVSRSGSSMRKSFALCEAFGLTPFAPSGDATRGREPSR